MIDLTLPWVLFRVRDQLFGVRATHIREMAEMPSITHVPSMPEYVMGLVSLRGQVTPAIDLRRRLGLPTADEDLRRLTDELEVAEAEHRRLAATLESVAQDGRATTADIPACRFQEWLTALQTRNPLVRLHLKKLEAPHAELHRAAARVLQAAESDLLEANTALRRFKEKELAAYLRLLPQTRERLVHAHRQIIAVLTLEGQSLGVAVDEVESIERLKDGSIEELPAHLRGLKSNLTRTVGRRTKDDEIVLILDVEELFHGTEEIVLNCDLLEDPAGGQASTPEEEPAPVSLAAAGVPEPAGVPARGGSPGGSGWSRG